MTCERWMGIVMIRCPRTGREVPTEYRMNRTDFERAPVFFARVYCRWCGGEHEWFAKDAWVCEPLERETTSAA
jgi:hypothetical protein